MHLLLRKLDLEDQARLVVLGAPPELQPTREAMGHDVAIASAIRGAR